MTGSPFAVSAATSEDAEGAGEVAVGKPERIQVSADRDAELRVRLDGELQGGPQVRPLHPDPGERADDPLVVGGDLVGEGRDPGGVPRPECDDETVRSRVL